MYPRASGTTGIAVPGHDDLISGNIRTQPLTVFTGTYVRGEVVELDAANSRLTKLTTEANAHAIITEDITLTAPTVIPVYIAGDFNEDAVDVNGADLTDTKLALAGRGIMLRKWGAAPDAV